MSKFIKELAQEALERNVNEEAFKARTRSILKKRGLYVELLNAKRNNWKGILVMK